VNALYEKLSSAGFHPFVAPKDILPGEDWKLKLMNTNRETLFFCRARRTCIFIQILPNLFTKYQSYSLIPDSAVVAFNSILVEEFLS